MISRFRHAALVGKYQAQGIRDVLEEIARFLVRQGLDVSLEQQTALNTGMTDYGASASLYWPIGTSVMKPSRPWLMPTSGVP